MERGGNVWQANRIIALNKNRVVHLKWLNIFKMVFPKWALNLLIRYRNYKYYVRISESKFREKARTVYCKKVSFRCGSNTLSHRLHKFVESAREPLKRDE